MPELGETISSTRIGLKGWRKLVWAECIDCGRQRWVEFIKASRRCHHCAPKQLSHHFREGITKGKPYRKTDGYMYIWLRLGNFFFPMANQGRKDGGGSVAEHRLVIAQHLGRCLQTWEKVHHKNGIRDDNRIGNLELTTAGSHILQHTKGYREGYFKGLHDGRDRRIKELAHLIEEQTKQIKLLRWQVKQLASFQARLASGGNSEEESGPRGLEKGLPEENPPRPA